MPEARPDPPERDLRGREPVRIRAEGSVLAAYGFGRQRVAIPAASIGSVLNHVPERLHADGMVVLDRDGRILLRAEGLWHDSRLEPVLTELDLPGPTHLSEPPPRWARAPGYRRLRVRSRWFVPLRLAFSLVAAVALLAAFGAGIFGGLELGELVPARFGAVGNLAQVASGLLGGLASVCLLLGGGWLVQAVAQGAIDRLASAREARPPAPARPLLPRGWLSDATRPFRLIAAVLAVPLLIAWGPGVLIVTMSNGFSDQALVMTLRQDGVSVFGRVIDVPAHRSNGVGQLVTIYHPVLTWTNGGRSFTIPDPDIAGRHWPVNPDRIITVIYNPRRPDQAAAAGQLAGSAWQGIPTANLISSSLLTLVLLVLAEIWRRAVRG